MELRHLRYFIAVAEEGSLTVAADRRLHTAQPSLSRQIRDLEAEVGVQLLIRSPRGIELTAAGRAAYPAKGSFVIGFLPGSELQWSEALRILHDELPTIDVVISSQSSPDLAAALLRRKVDVAFLRPEKRMPDLAFQLLAKEPLVAVLRSDHRLAALEAISPHDLVGETFISVPETFAPTLRVVI